MVKKRPRIVTKPNTSPQVEEWVKAAGSDPEVDISQSDEILDTDTAIEEEPVKAEKPKTKGKGGTFPHRISLDLSTEQYEALNLASFQQKRTKNEILREAADNWLKENGY